LKERLRSAPISTQAALVSFRPISDQYQQEVIRLRDRTIRLVAPAGSGKTQTMVNRVLMRIKEGLHPGRILLLTFDNAAAGSIRNSLQTSVASIETSAHTRIDISELKTSTLNAFGLSLLREFAPAEAKDIVSTPGALRLVKEVLDGLQTKSYERYSLLPPNLRRTYYLDFFSFLKNRLHDPRDIQSQALADLIMTVPQAAGFFSGDPDDDEIRRIVQSVIWLFTIYEKLLQRDGLMDFDDQKLRSYVILRDHPTFLRAVQRRFDEIVVDEFQDINLLDFELIKLIAARADLVVTGDDDQAIYGFRGCSPDYIIDLPKHLERAVSSLELSVNYRCPPNIVRHADQLIRHNQRRIVKNPRPHQTVDSTINVVPSLSANIEAKSFAEYIETAKDRNRSLGYDQFAILYRTNAQSLPIQVEFVLRDIPFLVRDEDNILQNQSLTRLLGALRAKLARERGEAVSPEDQVLTVQSYFRYVYPQDAARIRDVARHHDVLSADGMDLLYSVYPKAAQSQFADTFESLVRAETLDKSLEILGRRFRGLYGMVGSLEDAIEQRVPLAEISDIARDFEGNTDAFVTTLGTAMKRGRQVNAGRQEHGVQLLTYFKSKGRQWHTVILCSCNEGLIPHARSPVEDERRLFYVALTRASANLVVSYVENAVDNKVKPSRFLYESGLLRADEGASS
jgi:DNA helicase II / ATP-dependent DNA helicase PcrA